MFNRALDRVELHKTGLNFIVQSNFSSDYNSNIHFVETFKEKFCEVFRLDYKI